MKSFLLAATLLASLLFSFPVMAQDEQADVLTQADWEALIPHLEAEEWDEAEKLTEGFLKRFDGGMEMSDEAGIVRYMYLASIAAQVGDKEVSKEDALKKLKGFEGKNVITPFIMYKKDGMFNYFQMVEEGEIDEEGNEGEKKKQWLHCLSNSSATVIQMFDRFEMADPALLEEEVLERLEGKALRVTAKIKEIKADGYTMPRLQVQYTDADIWDLMEEE